MTVYDGTHDTRAGGLVISGLGDLQLGYKSPFPAPNFAFSAKHLFQRQTFVSAPNFGFRRQTFAFDAKLHISTPNFIFRRQTSYFDAKLLSASKLPNYTTFVGICILPMNTQPLMSQILNY
jgi:hypothetical protein